MEPSLTHGRKPSVNNRLSAYLESNHEEVVTLQADEFDRLIDAEKLRISRATFFRDLDMMLVILTNRRIINRRLSAYPVLHAATDEQLPDYIITRSGIHWPGLDADLSLRGFLMEETLLQFRASDTSVMAA